MKGLSWKGLSWANFILGIWLLLAPFTFGYAHVVSAALWEDAIVGGLIAILALWRAVAVKAENTIGIALVTAGLGLWSLIAPIALSYHSLTSAAWNDMIVGIVVAILALLSTLEKPSEKAGRMVEHRHGAH